MAETGIGASVRRKEDYRFLTGAGRYTGDIERPGQAYAYFVRSPHAHATINGIDKDAAVAATARALARIARGALPADGGIGVCGPAPADMALLRGRYRYRLLIKCARSTLPQPWLRRWLAELDAPSRVTLRVDVDPYSFL